MISPGQEGFWTCGDTAAFVCEGGEGTVNVSTHPGSVLFSERLVFSLSCVCCSNSGITSAKGTQKCKMIQKPLSNQEHLLKTLL